ncbi:alpha/beta-hydrolase family protein [Actinoplanes sp. NPDC026670]|uniref:alpha/beta-hydrolase family protein n=1 Tax=Actinoplanes sp. NPDC026670 TaxID=3154700 RepID=UPI0033CA2553
MPAARLPRLDLPGSVAATVLLCLSFTPSLLPRSWFVQGVVGGLCAATGYALGCLPRLVLPRWRAGGRAWSLFASAAVPSTILAACQGWRWQQQVSAMVGVDGPSAMTWVGALPTAAAVFAALLAVAGLVRRGGRATFPVREHRPSPAGLALRDGRPAPVGLAPRNLRSAPVRLAPPGRWSGTTGLIPEGRWSGTAGLALRGRWSGTTGLALRGRRHPAAATLVVLALLVCMQPLGALSTLLDSRVTDLAAPAEATRSGSPASLVPWATLGREGRAFVTGALAVRHARPPIRVYVGLRTASTSKERARLAVAELQRTGAFARQVLCLVIPTGSGWIDEPTLAALEDTFDGDTAVAAIQYSALPSWLSLAAEPERAETAAGDLIDEVRRGWSAMPATTRPKLLVYGHSLGARAVQAPFGSVDRLLDEVDGALISGPPSTGPLRERLLAGRSPASTEIAPALPGRPDIRFATGLAGLSTAGGTAYPRVVFLQHATDPVVWWSPGLLSHRPDWLRERRGDGVLPQVRWWPIVTFWQVSGDLLTAQDVPAGHGHRYGAEAGAAWRLLTGTGWSSWTRQERLPPGPGGDAIGGAWSSASR